MSNSTPATITDVAKQLDGIVLSVIGVDAAVGFDRAYKVSQGIHDLEQMLTTEYMAPIMRLQGTRLGFRTDKDSNGGYPEPIVRRCLIEAVFFGLQPYGNQFNIIAGNMYPTKEGLETVLNAWPGLKYSVILSVPRVSQDKTSAVIDATVKWTYKGESSEETMPIALKVNTGMGVDAMAGKAKRKACAWLRSAITGESTPEGDVEDITYTDVTGSGNAIDAAKEKLRDKQGAGKQQSML